jgi:leader peptidase (prepilin peptidase)/N-methyltransferase
VIDAFTAVPPEWLARILVGGLGLVVGSFLNVVIHRVPRGASVVTPRSACPGCGRLIRWYENVPVLSWLALRARCAGCGTGISWRYPLVEALHAALWVLAFGVTGWTRGLPIALLFVSLVLALVFIDLEHFLLPDVLTLPGTFAGLALSFASPFVVPADALLGVLVSIVAIEGMNLAFRVARGVDGFGAGDTKMMMMVGAFLGWRAAVLSLLAATLIGTIVGIPLAALARHRAARRAPVPDAPLAADGARTEEELREEAAGAAGADARGWRQLLPRTVAEAVPILILAVLGASYMVPFLLPEAALGGVLVGLALMIAVDAVVRRGGREWPATILLPLAGAAVGLPPSPLSAAAGLLAVAAVLAAGRRGFAPRDLSDRAALEAEEVDDLPPATTLMQAALPFGVFLGAGALVALLAYDLVVDTWLRLVVPDG